MADTATDDAATLIRRLERRLDRERRARREAEEIAERGMRNLYDANQELDARIMERTEQLQHALQAAESASDAKSAFLAQMSHQINTPLNGLMGMLELLATEIHDPQGKEWHRAALRSAERLNRMTSRLTTYVSLEGVDLTTASTRTLGAVLSAAHDRWHATCLRAGQLLRVDITGGSDALLVAPSQLDMALDELLSNAVAYAGAGSVVLVGRAAEPGEIEIELADAGPGIADTTVSAVLGLDGGPNQDQRIDDEIHLGLALVDRITAALGGTWSTTTASADRGSSRVTLRIPR